MDKRSRSSGLEATVGHAREVQQQPPATAVLTTSRTEELVGAATDDIDTDLRELATVGTWGK